MLQVILIHPGSTDYDQQQRIQGTLDIPLNAQGHVEIAQVIEQLRGKEIHTLYTPTGQPSLETAETVAAGLNVKLKKLNHMQNLNQGLWQGMLVEDVRRKQPKVYRQWQEQPENVCPPEGEMLSDADERVRTAMSKLLKRHKEGTIGVVAPEPLASLIRRFITRGELGDLWKVANGHGSWEVLEVEPEKAVAAS